MRPEPYPYQRAGADFLASHRHAYLADDPGLGKSAQAVLAADKIGAERILVVGPASLRVNWTREFALWSRHERPVVIPDTSTRLPQQGPLLCTTSYDATIRPKFHAHLRETQWDLVLADEAHALKTPAATRTRAFLGDVGLYRRAEYVWLMSGTPAPNHIGELYPVLARLYPKAVHGLNYDAWLDRYCTVIEGPHGPKVVGNKPAVSELREILQEFMLRRRRSEVLTDLPPLRTGTLVVENAQALSALRALEQTPEMQALAGLLGDQDVDEDVLEAFDDAGLSTLRRLYGEAKAHALVPVLADELENGTDKIVLMCWHHRTMDVLQEGLRKYGTARIDGKTKDRQAEVDRFQCRAHPTHCRVFVGQITAAGVGHTLTAASDMVIVEPSWVPGENVQAMLRIHRIGQHRGCLARYAALAGSLDEPIMGAAARKARDLAEVFG